MELRRAKIISVTSSKGGIGKTIFITNLAGIYQMLGKKVLLIDLDLFNGTISTLLNIHNDKTIYNFLDDLTFNRFNDVSNYLYKYSDNIDVITSCKDSRQGNKISPKLIEKVILNNNEKDEAKITNVIKNNIEDSNVEVIMYEKEIEINVDYKHKSFSRKIISNEPMVNYHYCGNYEIKTIENKKCY